MGNLSIHKTTGLDGMSAKLLEDSGSVIASPLAHITNLSLHLGCVPDKMKTARVIPLFKNKSKSAPVDYRPISILQVSGALFQLTFV